jgi:hypothetical protein
MNHCIPHRLLSALKNLFLHLSPDDNRAFKRQPTAFPRGVSLPTVAKPIRRFLLFVEAPPACTLSAPLLGGAVYGRGLALSLCFVVSVSQIDYESSTTRSLSSFAVCFMASLALSPSLSLHQSLVSFTPHQCAGSSSTALVFVDLISSSLFLLVICHCYPRLSRSTSSHIRGSCGSSYSLRYSVSEASVVVVVVRVAVWCCWCW